MLNLEAKNANEKLILAYLTENASESLVEKINAGKKTLKECWEYIRSEARGKASNGCACIEDSVVFGWAIHFFEEDSIKAAKARGNNPDVAEPQEDIISDKKPKTKSKTPASICTDQFSFDL